MRKMRKMITMRRKSISWMVRIRTTRKRQVLRSRARRRPIVRTMKTTHSDIQTKVLYLNFKSLLYLSQIYVT
jgi:hypothetical protein